MRKSLLASMLCSVMIALPLVAGQSASAAALSGVAASPQPPEPLLFSVKLGQGRTERLANGDFRLTARASEVVWFSDRPGRTVGVMPAAEFVRKWTLYGFKESAPNAALIANKRTSVFTLTNPRVLGKNVVFTARELDGENVSSGIAHHASRSQAPVAASFTSAALFIDDAADCDSAPAAMVNTAIQSARVASNSISGTINQAITQALDNGETPTMAFEVTVQELMTDLESLSGLNVDPSTNGLSAAGQLITLLTNAATGLSTSVQNQSYAMQSWEVSALNSAIGSLQELVSSTNLLVSTATTQYQQCEAALSPPVPSAQG